MTLPAPGPKPVIITQWIVLGLAAFVIAARLYLRMRIQKRRLLVSDVMICGALITAAANAAFDIKLAQMGALAPGVMTTLDGYDGTSEDKEMIMKNPETVCTAEDMIRVFQAAWVLHITGDILVFLIPWLVVSDMEIQSNLKVGIYGTFLLGIIDISFCLFRFIAIQTSVKHGTLPLGLNELCCSLDSNIGVMVATLPSLRPYFRRKNASVDLSNSTSLAKSARSGLESRSSDKEARRGSRNNNRRHPSIYPLDPLDGEELEDTEKSMTNETQVFHEKPQGGTEAGQG